MCAMKEAMNEAIPKSSHKNIYQFTMTEEIKRLERFFNILRQNAEANDWTPGNYREYLRMRFALRKKCKESCNKNWKEKVKSIT